MASLVSGHLDLFRIVVSGLSPETTGESLKQAFGHIGFVIHAKVYTVRNNGRSRYYGLIKFQNKGDAEKAVVRATINAIQVDGSNVRAVYIHKISVSDLQ